MAHWVGSAACRRSIPTASQPARANRQNPSAGATQRRQAAMDPLSVLRDYASRNELDKIIFSGNEIHFGSDYTFPASTPTAFASKQSGRPFPLSAAVFLAQHHYLKHTDFIQAARLRHIPPVSLPDRKTFLDFLLV
jgi:hypothetical protein